VSPDEIKLLRPYLRAIDSTESKVESLARAERPGRIRYARAIRHAPFPGRLRWRARRV